MSQVSIRDFSGACEKGRTGLNFITKEYSQGLLLGLAESRETLESERILSTWSMIAIGNLEKRGNVFCREDDVILDVDCEEMVLYLSRVGWYP